MERSLDFVLQGAGLIPVVASVEVPVLRLSAWRPGAIADSPTLVETRPSGALADLTYFWMTSCEPCLEGLTALARLDADPSLRAVLGIRIVVAGGDTPGSFAGELAATRWTRETLIDLHGGFAERLGVLGAPGVLVSDVDGRVVARFNGILDFDSPGFELFTATLKRMHGAASSQQNSKPISLASSLRSEVKNTPTTGAKFLGVPLTGYFLLFALLVVCYAVGKSVMRLRKNPHTG